MNWRIMIHTGKTQKFLYLFSIITMIVSFYSKSRFLFMVGVLITLSLFLSTKYLKTITDKIQFLNKKQVYRMFPDDEEVWHLTMTNRSRLPVLQSNLVFSMNKEVSLGEFKPRDERKGYNIFTLPLVFQPKETKTVQIPVVALKRGVAKISSFELHISDPLNLEQYQLLNDRLVRTEFIVYPTPVPVKGIHKLDQLKQGDRAVPLSLYEDQSLVIGTREYEPGDSFQRIHWKASARMNELQTKIYEKTLSQSWTILLNINVSSALISEYGELEVSEKQISHAAYLCQYATQHNIPFDMYVNIRTKGRVPYLHLEKGEGKPHLMRALELLSRMNINSVRVPMHRLLSMYDSWESDSTSVIVLGDRSSDDFYYDRWKKKGMDVFHVQLDGESASLERMETRRATS
ncbi:DUF58 domain-containing protein [Pseudalkalibacillus sp. Hm43]|uniref:DUF58 domain-containing protein n=1 Tax=Pseudalkalibacillus sp. Hm43 TaxID=3450742 RepID=UPI003F421AB8